MMYAAIIACAVAMLGIAGIMLTIALKLRDAEQRAAEARINDERKAGTIALRDKSIEDLKAAVAVEKRRADAFDAELDQVAQDGDTAGARERVHRLWLRQDKAASDDPAVDGGDSPGAVHHDTPTEAEPASQPADGLFPSRI